MVTEHDWFITRSASDMRLYRRIMGLSKVDAAWVWDVSRMSLATWENPNEFGIGNQDVWRKITRQWYETFHKATQLMPPAQQAGEVTVTYYCLPNRLTLPEHVEQMQHNAIMRMVLLFAMRQGLTVYFEDAKHQRTSSSIRLRMYLDLLDIHMTRFADWRGVSRQTVSRWRNNRHEMAPEAVLDDLDKVIKQSIQQGLDLYHTVAEAGGEARRQGLKPAALIITCYPTITSMSQAQDQLANTFAGISSYALGIPVLTQYHVGMEHLESSLG